MNTDTDIHMQGYRCIKCGENRVHQEGLMCHHCEDSTCAQCGGENEQQGRDRDLCVKCAKLEEAILKHAWWLYGAVKSHPDISCAHIYETVGHIGLDGLEARCAKCGEKPSVHRNETLLSNVIQAIESEAKLPEKPEPKGVKTQFSKVPLGSKIANFEVVWPDQSYNFYEARKTDCNAVRLLTGKEKGVGVLVGKDEEVFVIERPHEDGDFSYLCNGEYCRCQQ